MTLRPHAHIRRLIAAVAGCALVIVACGSDDGSSAVDPAPATTADATESTEAPTMSPPSGRGWIDGEPEWNGSLDESAESFDAEATSAVPAAESRAADDTDDAVAAGESATLDEALAVEPTSPPVDRPIDTSPLRAGSVDDNADFTGFLSYLDRIADLGVTTRDFDPTGRSIISVVDEDGRPVPGIALEVVVGDELVTLRTTADGTARFHPAFYGAPTDGTVEFGFAFADMELVPVAAGDDVTMVAPASTIGDPVPLDVLFLLDATGSMGDEIDRLKQTIDFVAERVTALDPAPDVRFAMTLYRDEDDAFVTANYDFTGDIGEFQAALADVVADGGGDYPEALDEGLADALTQPAWRDPSDAVQLIFVVADAPPQVGRQVEVPYTDSVRTAIERGIKIFPVASSESDDQAEAVFRQMAQATGAPFVFLSNGAAGAATGESTDITSTDYEELALDELVVRLIAEELSDLNGDGGASGGGQVTVPTTVPPVTTNPDGQ